METPKEYYYTYYSYEEWGRGYFGSRKCYCLPEEDVKYFGSSKDKNFRPTQKIILKNDYATREEAYADEIILQQHYKVVENPHFANRAYQTSTKFYVPIEQAKETGRKVQENNRKNKTSFFGYTKEQLSEAGKLGGSISYKMKVGIHGMGMEEKIEIGRKNGLECRENNIGIFSRTPEQHSKHSSKGGKNTNSQKWECLETGFITNPGNLTKYQKARGIDTSKRKRVD
jgi:hypothetical protein